MLGTEPTEDARNQPEHGSHWPAYELAGASTNIDTTGGVDPGWNGAGWVEVEYGISGNVASFTVHGQCHDNGALECSDSTGTLTSRIEYFREACSCAEEQHYRYRWDELNRLVDGLRYDRATGGSWTYGARMRYRYDGAHQRTVKQSFAATDLNTPERHALYVYPGDFERRGLTVGFGTAGPTYLATTGTADATETQYLIAGARIVWDGEPDITGPGIDRNRRATVSASDLLGTTTASLDLESGALLEVSTYYPNGARENLWADGADVPLEPMGFTGKEADEEIGVTYFGERWLIPRLGRWATPDPLHVHAAGGGEALNSYHYVSGNLLQAVDPLGLDREFVQHPSPFGTVDQDLVQATYLTAQLMSSQMAEYWGIQTAVTVHEAAEVRLSLAASDPATVAAARSRVESLASADYASATSPVLTREQFVAKRLGTFDEGRNRLLEWLGPGGEYRPVEILTEANGSPLIEGQYMAELTPPPFGHEDYRLNPYTYFNLGPDGWHYTMEDEDPLAALMVGPTTTLGLHESSHEYGCLNGAGADCTTDATPGGSGETHTVQGVDAVLGALGAPPRGTHYILGDGTAEDPYRHDLQGSTVELPTSDALGSGRAEPSNPP